jgi:hypothetical protein
MQHADIVQRPERRSELSDVAECGARLERRVHAGAQVAPRKNSIARNRMIVGDAEIVDTRDVGMIEMRDQLVFAQEPFEGRVALDHVRHLPEDLQHELRAGRDAFRQEYARGAADGQPTDTAVTADAHGAEAVRRLGLPRDARRLGEQVAASRQRVAQRFDELRVLEIGSCQHIGCARRQRATAQGAGLWRCEVDDRRERRTLGEILEPFETPPVLHFMIEQHHVVRRARESRPQSPTQLGFVLGRVCAVPFELHVVTDRLPELDAVADDEHPQRHAAAPARQASTRSPTFVSVGPVCMSAPQASR